jgi:hypothetical protein
VYFHGIHLDRPGRGSEDGGGRGGEGNWAGPSFRAPLGGDRSNVTATRPSALDFVAHLAERFRQTTPSSLLTQHRFEMDGYGYGSGSNSYPQAGSSSSGQQGQEVNPYHLPYKGPMYSQPSSHTAPIPANAYEYDVGILAQQSVYVPGAAIDKRGGAGGKLAKGGKRTTVLRKGAGKVWEDQTLLEWNPCTSDGDIAHVFVLTGCGQLGSGCSWATSATTFPTTSYQTPSTSILRSKRLGSFVIA